ncbi:MAG: apolipoprotein A1/A4/E family protein [Actinomycetia bacterium]|nr:apolipoprotein A1/A4/E family protein [Actinomycetes bacterium]
MNETARLHPDVAEFAATVRRRLDDLEADEVEELTGDLEADLQERLEETGADLGDPGSYAAELRAAAGLAPRVAEEPAGSWLERSASVVTDRLMRLETRLRSGPTSAAVLDFAIALRPVWWVLRAWIVFEIVHIFFNTGTIGTVLPDSAQEWLVFLVAVVVSVQWGRGLWFPWRWARKLLIVGTVASVLLLPVAIDHAVEQSSMGRVIPVSAIPKPPRGLAMNGRPVRNVFGYDAQGNPIRDVQLFNGRGKPLRLGPRWRNSWGSIPIPPVLQSGRKLWNVYPLAWLPRRDTVRDPAGRGRIPGPGVEVERPAPPFTRAPAVSPTVTTGDEGQSGIDKSVGEQKGGGEVEGGKKQHQ